MRTPQTWRPQAGWLARLARGLDDEAVKPRLLPKSVGCSKTFRGRSALTTLKLVHDWLLSIGARLPASAARCMHACGIARQLSRAVLPRRMTVANTSGLDDLRVAWRVCQAP
jgi:nucleotidyltransferase/DNA polymerase involved in DNA repair